MSKGSAPIIDMVDLIATCSTEEWNKFLTMCYQKHDIPKLLTVKEGIQRGMNKLVKDKLNTEDNINLFIRLQRSIEITIKKIIREKQPNPLDNPLNKPNFMHKYDEKKKRDHEIELFMKRNNF